MKKNKLKLLFAFLSIFLLSIFSVLSHAEDKPKPSPDGKVVKIKFPKLEGYEASLKCVTTKPEDMTFRPGAPAKLTFGLKNEGANPIITYEWMMKESDNLRIYYTPWKEGMKTPEKNSSDWILEKPEIKGNPRRMPLELHPKNTVLLEKEIQFVKDIKPGFKEKKYFLIYAELNLDSFSAFSKPVQIAVEPAAAQ